MDSRFRGNDGGGETGEGAGMTRGALVPFTLTPALSRQGLTGVGISQFVIPA